MLVGFIIFAVIFGGLLAYSIYLTAGAIKNKVIKNDYNHLLKLLAYFGAGVVASFTLWMVFAHLSGGHKPTAYEWCMTIFGSIFAMSLGYVSLHTFMIHYWCKQIPEKMDKWLFRTLIISFPLMFVFIFVLSEGFASYLITPYKSTLVYGISFSAGWVTPSSGIGNNIAFYAVCILTGAIYVYFYCDHKMYIEYGKHGILESTFLVAFPAGIIGARLFYVLGELDKFIGRPIAEWFDITKGGLTILGGALTGIVVGVLWFRWRHKECDIFITTDIVVPSILIAQAVGRWGNFFNCEVHGISVDASYWNWLPAVIRDNIKYSSTLGFAAEGKLFVPLFLIESIINFLGFFVLAHLFGKKLKKFTEYGDITAGYLIWYGFTRALMEPLRDSHYNMGKNGFWSWIWSFAFILGGALIIFVNHLVRFKLDKKHKKLFFRKSDTVPTYVAFGIMMALAIGLTIPGIVLMATGQASTIISYSQFNIGLLLLVSGLGFLFLSSVSAINIYKRYIILDEKKHAETL